MTTTTRRRYEKFPEGSYAATSGEGKHRIYRGYAIYYIPPRSANIHDPYVGAAYEPRSVDANGHVATSRYSTITAHRYSSRVNAARAIDYHIDGVRPADW